MLLAALAAFAVTVRDANGIAPDDAARLQPVFTFRTDNPGAHTEAPQVDGSRLIVHDALPAPRAGLRPGAVAARARLAVHSGGRTAWPPACSAAARHRAA